MRRRLSVLCCLLLVISQADAQQPRLKNLVENLRFAIGNDITDPFRPPQFHFSSPQTTCFPARQDYGRRPFRPFERATPERLSTLIHRLASDNPEERREAMHTLAAMGPPAASAASHVEEILAREPSLRVDAARALQRFGSDVSKAVSLLMRQLDSEDPDERRTAAEALAVFWYRARPALGALARATTDPEPSVRVAALHAYGRLGMPDEETVIARLSDSDSAVRRSALRALRCLPVVDGRYLPDLIRFARSEDDSLRTQALLAIAELGLSAAPAVGVLREALAAKNHAVADAALLAVKRIGQSASPAAPGLIDYIRNGGARIEACVRLLAGIGDAHVVPDLLELARSGTSRFDAATRTRVRRTRGPSLMTTLDRIAERDPYAITLLRQASTDEDRRLAGIARSALERFSCPNRPRVLGSAQHDQAKADLVIPIHLANLESNRGEARLDAALELGQLGARAKSAARVLTQLLDREQDQAVRCATILALARIAPGQKAALPLVREALSDPSDWLTKAAALWCLGRCDARPDATVRHLLAHGSERVRNLAIWYVGKARDAQAIPGLIGSLDDSDDCVAATAAWALGRFGPGASRATEPLVKLSENRPQCNRAAMAALHRIAPLRAFAVTETRMKSDNPKTRCAAVNSFAEARTQIDRAIAGLAAALADDHRDVRLKAVLALRGYLLEWQRRKASGALDTPGSPPPVFRSAIPNLVEIIAHPEDRRNREARPEAVYLLQCLAPLATDAVPDLLRLLPDTDAMRVLGAIGPAAAAAVPGLIEALNIKRDHRIARAAAEALAGIGPAARDAISALLHFSDDPDFGPVAVWALEKLDAEPDLVVPVLLEILNSTANHFGRFQDTNRMLMLSSWADKSDEMLPALIRFKHLRPLRRFGPAAAPAVPMLIDVLQNGHEYRRAMAASTLAAIGPKASSALDALWKALDDPSTRVREEARRAIVAIESNEK